MATAQEQTEKRKTSSPEQKVEMRWQKLSKNLLDSGKKAGMKISKKHHPKHLKKGMKTAHKDMPQAHKCMGK